MDTESLIREVRGLLEDELATSEDNEIYKSYKARNISNYANALRSLMDVKKTEEKNG